MRVQQILAQTEDFAPNNTAFTTLAQTTDAVVYLYETSAPGASLDQPISGKLGICGNAWRKEQVSHVSNAEFSWMYNYFHWLTNDDHIEWANEQGIEFVPMLDQNKVKLRGWDKCWLTGYDKYGNEKEKCDKDRIQEELAETISQLVTPTRYLIGLNEPFDKNDDLPDKWVVAEDAAKLWGEYWMPIAKELGLKLVSSTTIQVNDKADWMGDFFKHCWELRDAEVPCDVETVEVLNIHHYSCYYDDYINKYSNTSTDEDSFYWYLINHLTDPEWEGHDQFDWETFILSRPIWITETSCNADYWPRQTVYQHQQCERMTGIEGGDWGEGSFQAFKDIDNIHRVAPFVFYGSETWEHVMLVNNEGELLPTGRAILSDLDPEAADCYAEPQYNLVWD